MSLITRYARAAVARGRVQAQSAVRACVAACCAASCHLGCSTNLTSDTGESASDDIAVARATLAASNAPKPAEATQQEITIARLPYAKCTVTSISAHENMDVWADDEGLVHLWAARSRTSNLYTLDCDDTGGAAHNQLDLADARTFLRAVPRAVAKGRTTVPALTDPMSLSQEELIRSGYGLRPNPNSPMYQKWVEAVSLPGIAVAPHSLEFTGERFNPESPGTSPTWGGLVLAGANMRYSAVVGYFAAPSFAGQGTNSSASFWPGLGGLFQQELIQDGIEFKSVGGMTAYFSWYEYVPDHPRTTPGIVFGSGDQLIFEAWEGDSQCNFGWPYGVGYGCFWFKNLATGLQSGPTPIVYPAPPGTNFQGGTCESIMERNLDPNTGQLVALASWPYVVGMQFDCYDLFWGYHDLTSEPYFNSSIVNASNQPMTVSAKYTTDTGIFGWLRAQ